MGNKQSCACVFSGERGRRKKNEEKYRYQPADPEPPPPARPASSSNLPHISEREPDDTTQDPSNHPTARTIFLTRSKSEIQKNDMQDPSLHPTASTLFLDKSKSDTPTKHRDRNARHSRHENHHVNEFGNLKKYSSCSTIFLDDSTVSQPNLKNTIKAVALAVFFHIRNREREANHTHNDSERLLDIFDEKLHPLSKDPVPSDYDRRDPEHKTIYRFIRTLFNAAQLTAECAIVTLVYLERLLTYAEIDIVPANWKRIVLGAILLASKVWDDQAVWNVDYCQILKDITVEDMNELERQFLEMLQFNINVPSSVYAKYYFDLRALADAHDLCFPLEPLSKERAGKLEAMANVYESQVRQSHQLKRSHSLDGLTYYPKPSKAILS